MKTFEISIGKLKTSRKIQFNLFPFVELNFFKSASLKYGLQIGWLLWAISFNILKNYKL